jgi:DNA-binding MarR family transcriptional regulator
MTKTGHEGDDAARNDAAAREAWQAMAALVLDNERRREVSERVGLSFGKTRALRRVARRPRSMKELAGLLGVDPPNLTPMVDELERSGLVERRVHPSDRRVKLVVATDEGAARARQAEEILGRPPAGLSGLDSGELAALVAILAKVRGDRGSGLGPGP